MNPTANEPGRNAGKVSCVVVSFNTKLLTLRCLAAFFEADCLCSEVCVVDNASTDGTAIALEREPAEWALSQVEKKTIPKLQVISLSNNIGFGSASNVGVGSTNAPFVALVNSDAFVFPGALQVLRDYLLANPKVGVVGPRLLNADGSIQESRFAFPTPWRVWGENLGISRFAKWITGDGGLSQGAVEWLSGACLMFRREAWRQVQGFDESFFLYSEEIDLQRRMQLAGWEVHWVPEAVVTHLGGSSGAVMREVVRECVFDGGDRYFLKHYGRLGAISLRAATATGAALHWVRATLGGHGRATEAEWIFRRQISRALPRVNRWCFGGHSQGSEGC
ncbi:MAG: glycosyltransferase family 2 protein [Verrucomicrobiota bacterium]